MHVAPLLRGVADSLGKPQGDLRVYDPYFCQGSVKVRLGALGFHHVINRNEDFYKVAEGECYRIPSWSVLGLFQISQYIFYWWQRLFSQSYLDGLWDPL
ncbi:unnamed protein product [Discosporangium mesarthrocarpum]